MRGEIYNRARAQQQIDFSGLCFGTITPTDIDGLVEFHDKLFIYLEAKLVGAELPHGQRLALERVCDRLQKSGVSAAILVVEHDTEPDEDIYIAACPVREYRFKGAWHEPARPVTCRQAIEKLRELAGIPL